MHWYNGRILAVVLMMVLIAVATHHSHAAFANSYNTSKPDGLSDHYLNSTILLKRLLEGYDRRIRPGRKDVPAVVRVDMYVSNIWAIQEMNMDFTIDIYLRQYWNDERLSYKDYSSASILTLSSDINKQIWIPSTYFIGTKKAYFHDVTTDNYLLQVRPDGSLFYSMRLTITTSCQLDLRDFPHDTQMCTLSLESYGYQATDVLYVWNERIDNTSAIYLRDALELPQFEVMGVKKRTQMNLYNIGNHSALVAVFKMKRRIGYFLIDTYIPSTIIVIISWISFWIDPETAPARVALGITTVLTMTTLISSARANLPKVSYVKAIDWYLLLCLIFVFGSILEYTCVTFVIAKQKRTRKKVAMRRESACHLPNNKGMTPADLRFLESPPCRIHNKTEKASALNRVLGRDDANIKVGSKPYTQDNNGNIIFRIDPTLIDNGSRFLFPLVFLGFNVVYWMVYGS